MFILFKVQRPEISQLLISFQVNATVSWMLRRLIDRLIIIEAEYTVHTRSQKEDAHKP